MPKEYKAELKGLPSEQTIADILKEKPYIFNSDTQKVRDLYSSLYWEGMDENRNEIIDSNQQHSINRKLTEQYYNNIIDNPFEIDPLVKYRMIGKSALDAFDDIGILTGPIERIKKGGVINMATAKTKMAPNLPALFFSQSVPLFQYGHGQLLGRGTAHESETPYLVATVGHDSTWYPRDIPMRLFTENPYDSKNGFSLADGSIQREHLDQMYLKIKSELGKLPKKDIGGFLKQYLSADTDLMSRISAGKKSLLNPFGASKDEIESVLGPSAYLGWKGGFPNNYVDYLDGPDTYDESILDIKPWQGSSFGAKTSEKLPYTSTPIIGSLDLAKRPFAIWEYGDKGFQLINEGNNKPLFNGVKPIPTAPIDMDEKYKTLISALKKFNNPPSIGSLGNTIHGAGGTWATVDDILKMSQKKNSSSRKGFINTGMLGSNLATELTTLTPYEAGMLNIAKSPEMALDFAKFAKANPSWVAGQTLNTLGRAGAVASIAMAPSQAMSRRDKLAYDFYSQPEAQRLSKEDESKINAYLGVRAGLENVLDVATLGSGIPDYIIHNETPWWASEIAKGKQYEHEYQGQGFTGK